MSDYAIVNLLELDDTVQGRVEGGFEAGPDGLELIAVGGPRPERGDGQPTDARWPDERES